MKNYLGKCDVITFTAPSGGVSSGDGMLVDAMFGIATGDVAEGADGEMQLVGGFRLPKTSAQAWTVGQPIYWDDTTKKADNTAPGNVLIGVAIAAADNPSSFGDVRLNGAFAIEPQT
jgi:predicted RecA/RadA family phage recombinase